MGNSEVGRAGVQEGGNGGRKPPPLARRGLVRYGKMEDRVDRWKGMIRETVERSKIDRKSDDVRWK